MTAVANAEMRRLRSRAAPTGKPPPVAFDPKAKTAVILVSGFNGTGLHTLFSVRKVFGDAFKQLVLHPGRNRRRRPVQGHGESWKLRAHVEESLNRYVGFLKAEGILCPGLFRDRHRRFRRDLRSGPVHLREVPSARLLRRPDRVPRGQLSLPPALQPHDLRRTTAPPPAGHPFPRSCPVRVASSRQAACHSGGLPPHYIPNAKVQRLPPFRGSAPMGDRGLPAWGAVQPPRRHDHDQQGIHIRSGPHHGRGVQVRRELRRYFRPRRTAEKMRRAAEQFGKGPFGNPDYYPAYMYPPSTMYLTKEKKLVVELALARVRGEGHQRAVPWGPPALFRKGARARRKR